MILNTTIISDTHVRHHKLTDNLIGGDLLIHCGDVSSTGNKGEILYFLEWFSELPYRYKVFIAGNHDFFFEREKVSSLNLLSYNNLFYLNDMAITIEGLKIYGSPYQPWFHNWAFNLPRNGEELEHKWSMIPDDTDILITHGPPFGILDKTIRNNENAGCELLRKRVDDIKPLIHTFGHIHEGYGELQTRNTLFINGSNLNEMYQYTNKPINLIIDTETKIIV
jgi:Icc-related predicted phosphoesterase